MLEDVPLPRGSNRKASHAIAIDNSSAPIAAAISQATPKRWAAKPPTRDAHNRARCATRPLVRAVISERHVSRER
jgi:hypothetical protein